MFGQRLRLARKKAGLSMRELAKRMSPEITAQAISKYEAGKMNPSSSVLVGLGKLLGVSLDFLMGSQVEALVGVEFRKHSRTSAKDIAHAEAIVIERLENYLVIEDILDIALPEDPFGDFVTDRIDSWDDLDRKARDLRNFWKLGNDPVSSMSRLLEDKGIKVIEADFAERLDGLACKVKRGGDLPNTNVVVISSRTNVERKRFNLAHELAHRVVRQTGNASIKLEKAMDRFAGVFLVPTDHLIEEAGQVRSRMIHMEIMRLKGLYGVSAATILMRLGQAGILPQSSIDHAFRTYARKWRNNEPDPVRGDEGFGAFEHPQRFERLVWRALGEELISPIRAAQMLCLSLATVEKNIKGYQYS